MESSVLDRVEAFAREAHGAQRRKFVNEPYINHPIRVMQTCRRITDDITMLSAALLHDVLEDTPVTPDELHAFLQGVMDAAMSKRTLDLVTELTDVYTHAAYPKLNRRARKEKELLRLKTTSPDSQTIKYADIIDNAEGIAGDDFAPRLLQEMRVNLREMKAGNPLLYREATEKVMTGLRNLGWQAPKR